MFYVYIFAFVQTQLRDFDVKYIMYFHTLGSSGYHIQLLHAGLWII